MHEGGFVTLFSSHGIFDHQQELRKPDEDYSRMQRCFSKFIPERQI